MNDFTASGRWAGVLLAQNLLDIGDGLTPMNSPVGGVGRFEGDTKFTGVHFPDAPDDIFGDMVVSPSFVRDWIARETLREGVLIRHLRAEQGLHVLLPWCDERDWFALVVWFRYAVEGGKLRVSMPEFQKDRNAQTRWFHDLIDAMRETRFGWRQQAGERRGTPVERRRSSA